LKLELDAHKKGDLKGYIEGIKKVAESDEGKAVEKQFDAVKNSDKWKQHEKKFDTFVKEW